MKKHLGLIGLTALFLTFCASAEEMNKADSVIALLHTAEPSVKWDAKTAVSADVNCDGRSDISVVGYEGEDHVWLGVVTGSADNKPTKPITMQFFLGKHSQDSFCSAPVTIEKQPLDCKDAEEGTLPGCKVVKGCFSLSMDDGSCDSFNFYWDRKQKELAWWRL